MPKPQKVKYIVIHCTAGFSKPKGIERFWRNTLNWRYKGYSVIINTNGDIYVLEYNSRKNGYFKINYSDIINCSGEDEVYTEKFKKAFSFITNGVKGFNNNSIHISYIGGVDKNNVNKAVDTRTEEQKKSLVFCIEKAKNVLKEALNKEPEVLVCGHRDFSNDKNGSGVIESWERIKECPSFDAISEYEKYTHSNLKGKLP